MVFVIHLPICHSSRKGNCFFFKFVKSRSKPFISKMCLPFHPVDLLINCVWVLFCDLFIPNNKQFKNILHIKIIKQQDEKANHIKLYIRIVSCVFPLIWKWPIRIKWMIYFKTGSSNRPELECCRSIKLNVASW